MRRLSTTARLLEPAFASSSRRAGPRVALAARNALKASSSTTPSFLPSAARLHSSHAQAAAPPAPIPAISSEDTYDIVIIGGGPAGLALASALGEWDNLWESPSGCLGGAFINLSLLNEGFWGAVPSLDRLISSSFTAADASAVSHKTLRETTRILLLEGGSLAPVRGWDDAGGWSNRVSSLTAENIEWLDSKSK